MSRPAVVAFKKSRALNKLTYRVMVGRKPLAVYYSMDLANAFAAGYNGGNKPASGEWKVAA